MTRWNDTPCGPFQRRKSRAWKSIFCAECRDRLTTTDQCVTALRSAAAKVREGGNGEWRRCGRRRGAVPLADIGGSQAAGCVEGGLAKEVVGLTELESVTSCVSSRRSNQLSYRPRKCQCSTRLRSQKPHPLLSSFCAFAYACKLLKITDKQYKQDLLRVKVAL